jgi:hypothetical protein
LTDVVPLPVPVSGTERVPPEALPATVSVSVRVPEAAGEGHRDRAGSARRDRLSALLTSTGPVIAPWLPSNPTGLNPVEGIRSALRRTTTANRAFPNPEDLITTVRRGLRQLQYRPDILDGRLTGTGLRQQPP